MFYFHRLKNSSVIIRNATKDDIESFVDVYIDAYRDYEIYAYTSIKDIKRYFRWLFKRDRGGFFVAEISEPVGFAVCDTNWFSPFEGKKLAELHELFVRSKFKGKGVGSKLLERAIEYGRERKRDAMGLWVGEKNEPAKRFYRKHGFIEKGKFGVWIRMLRKI